MRVLRYEDVEFPRSAFKPGVAVESIAHALAQRLVVVDLDVDGDPPPVLAVGLKSRRRGRPLIGSAPAEAVPVRIDPELKALIDARAVADHTTASDVIREALRRYLDVA